tara:strand:- start:25467 stop:25958 length:492 start_codon:yes stop_codon:yes gene_type:complete
MNDTTLKRFATIPIELKKNILKYLPILTLDKLKLNQSIKSLYKMKILVKAYSSYFNVYNTTISNDVLLYLSMGWLYSDLKFFLNETKDIGFQGIQKSFKIFLKRFYSFDITFYKDFIKLEKYYDNNDLKLFHIFAENMSECEIDSFIIYINKVYPELCNLLEI